MLGEPGKSWLILMGGKEADLMGIYDRQKPEDQRTVEAYVKYGNVQVTSNTLYINLQKQLQTAGCTYKPFGTHMTLARWGRSTNQQDITSFARRIASRLGNRKFALTLEAWGPHSVRVMGPMYQSIYEAFAHENPPAGVGLASPLHVELRPRLPAEHHYIEVNHWEVPSCHHPMGKKRKPSDTEAELQELE